MKCERIQDLFADQWSGALDAGSRARLESHLSECASCREEWETLNRLWAKLGAIPHEEPGPGVRTRFYAMLEGYQQGLDRARVAPAERWSPGEWFAGWALRRPVFQLGSAAALLLAGFLGGVMLRPARDGHDELASLRQEVHEMRQMVTISLLKQQSASERLKGVGWSTQVNRPDAEVLTTLMHTLNYDPNVDVRLAAVDALSRFAGDRAVRDGLIQSLSKQDSPMVKISLIDLLVQLNDRQSIDVLKQLTNDSSQNQQVRQRAQWGLQKLS
jgi:hypothetical protein